MKVTAALETADFVTAAALAVEAPDTLAAPPAAPLLIAPRALVAAAAAALCETASARGTGRGQNTHTETLAATDEAAAPVA